MTSRDLFKEIFLAFMRRRLLLLVALGLCLGQSAFQRPLRRPPTQRPALGEALATRCLAPTLLGLWRSECADVQHGAVIEVYFITYHIVY